MTESLKAVIVDDEPHGRELIQHMLDSYFPEIGVEAKYRTVAEAVANIRDDMPRILFLDVRLEDGLGFDILECIQTRQVAVIFVTGYSDYALTAFKAGAVDYIMKPVERQAFFKAVERAKEKLARYLKSTENGQAITIRQIDSLEIVHLSRIMYLKSEGNYTSFFFENGERLVASKTLKEYSDLLETKGFFRSHRSLLVNLKYAKTYRFTEGVLILTDGTPIDVAKSKHAELTQILRNLYGP